MLAPATNATARTPARRTLNDIHELRLVRVNAAGKLLRSRGSARTSPPTLAKPQPLLQPEKRTGVRASSRPAPTL